MAGPEVVRVHRASELVAEGPKGSAESLLVGGSHENYSLKQAYGVFLRLLNASEAITLRILSIESINSASVNCALLLFSG